MGLWQTLRRAYLHRAIIAAIKHVALPPHLREPGRGHAGADTHIVGQEDASPATRRRHVDLLDQLPSRIMAKTRDVAGRIIFARANVEAIERAVGLPLERDRFFRADMSNAGTIGNVAGIGLRALEQADPAAPVSAMLQVVCCESPADLPSAQPHPLVRDTGIDERLGSDDRPGAPRAI